MTENLNRHIIFIRIKMNILKVRVFILSLFILIFGLSSSYPSEPPNLHLITTLIGEENGLRLRHAIAPAGDVNGDGYDDIAVGGRDSNTGQSKVYIYCGGYLMDTEPNIVLSWDESGESQEDGFGSSLTSGDVNGDGFSDIIVGAPYADIDEIPQVGKVGIYFGSENMDSLPDIILSPLYLDYYAMFGSSVSSGGDINNDGYDDIVVGAPLLPCQDFGYIYLFLGGRNMDTIADLIIEKEGGFHNQVNITGDVNGDGYDDFIVGWDTYYPTYSTGVDLYFGDSITDSLSKLRLTGDVNSVHFGKIGRGKGDINGDGFYDIIISDWGDSTGGVEGAGRVFVYLGGNKVDNVPDISLSRGLYKDAFGTHLCMAGDINRDGYDDILVSAPRYYPELNEVLLYFGCSPMDTILDGAIIEENVNDDLGACAYAGYVNNDFYSAFIISAPQYKDSNNVVVCKVYIYSLGDEEIHIPRCKVSAFPNPFSTLTTIEYHIASTLGREAQVSLKIYNVAGQIVKTLVDEKKTPDSYYLYWNGRDNGGNSMANGVYFCRIIAKGSVSSDCATSKLLLLK